MNSLDDNARAAFDRDGYIIFRNIFAPDEVAQYRERITALIAQATAAPTDLFGNYYLQHRTDQGALYDLYQRDPLIRPMFEHPALAAAIASVYADEYYLFENSMVYKPKGAANEVPWHQDYMYMTGDPDKVIIWAPVDDVDRDNGCMFVLPGTHKRGPLPYHKVKGETHAKRTYLDGIETEGAVAAEMKAGDVLIFHQFILHSSERVDTPRPRRALRFAVKTLDNSYTPRASPIMLSRRAHGSALEQPVAPAPPSARARIGRMIEKVGRRIAR